MKSNLKKVAFSLLLLIICFNFIPVAIAKTRQGHIIDFIYSKKNSDETFGITAQDTANAIEIINHYEAYTVPNFLGVTYSVDKTLLEEKIISLIQEMFDSSIVDLYGLYYYLKALDILMKFDLTLETSLHDKIYGYINQTYHLDGGFKPSNSSTYSNIISTYYVIEIHLLINELIINDTLHKNWINSCYNADGGYGANQTIQSTLLTTYYAVELLDLMNATYTNQTATYNYLNSFFIDDNTDKYNFGGYLPTTIAERALLSSTFYGASGKWLIDRNNVNKEATIPWVLNLQNFQDGGFAENLESDDQKKSSIVTTYYAFSILRTFDAEHLLNEEIFMVEFNFIILIIVLTSIAGVLALLYIIHRRRKI